MAERHEPAGGVRGQLRSLAMRGSLDGEWAHARAQSVKVRREASIAGAEEGTLGVAFDAWRYLYVDGEHRRPRMLTRYSLTASMLYEDLPPELVPGHVRFALKQKKLADWNPFEHQIDIIPTNADEADERIALDLLYDDCVDIDDALFQFERKVGFTFDGRGQVLRETRSDRYAVSEESSALVDVVGEIELKDSNGFARHWVEKGEDSWDFTDGELLKHPDLEALEFEVESAQLHDDLVFTELVQRTESDRRLTARSQAQRRQQALGLLAFLRYDAPVSDVTTLLYD